MFSRKQRSRFGAAATSFGAAILLLLATAAEAGISQFTGGDMGEGLDFSGTYVYAVDVNGSGGQTIQGLTFTPEATTPGVTLSSMHTVTGTVTYDSNTTTNDQNLGNLMTRIRWSSNYGANDTNTVALNYNVVPGYQYEVQLLLDSSAYAGRHQDVVVDGVQVADNLALTAPAPQGTGPGQLVTYQYTATGNSTLVELGPSNFDGDTKLAGDNNPVLNAFAVRQLNSDTIGYWRMNDAAPGTAATAVHSMYNDGTLQGTAFQNGASTAPTHNADIPGRVIRDGLTGPDLPENTASLEFFGSDYVEVPFSELVEPEAFTIEFFMKDDAQSTFPALVQKPKQHGGGSTAIGPGDVTWGIGKNNNDQAFIRVDTTDAGNRTTAIPGSTADGLWHHFAMTYEEVEVNGQPTGRWTLFRDSDLTATITGPGVIDYDGLSGLYFGGESPSAQTGFQPHSGLIDEIRLTGRVLGPGEFLRVVPEPGSGLLLLLGGVGLTAFGRRRRRQDDSAARLARG
jgi:hypothetical protein